MPFGAATAMHRFASSSQAPRRHASAMPEQSSGAPPHRPAVQRSFVVQNKPSSHAELLAFGAVTHAPVPGSHEPTRHELAGCAQLSWVPVHTPLLQ